MRGLFAIAIAVVVVATTVAQDGLRVRVGPAFGTSRSGGPIPVVVETEWPGPDVLKGRLRFVARDHLGKRFDLTTETIAIPPGRQRSLRLFPTATSAMNAGPLDLQTTFTSDGGDVVQLKKQALSVPQEMRRTVLVGALERVGGTRLPTDLSTPTVVAGARARDRSFVVDRVPLPPEGAPATPIAWCAFDTVLATLDALVALDGERFEALSRWVDGGGSVFVWAPLPCASVPGAIDRITRWHSGAVEVEGSIHVPRGLKRTRRELGRVVLACGEEKLDAWRYAGLASAIDWLWKTRHAPKLWVTDEDDVGRRVLHDDEDAAIVEHLLPQDVRLVPTGLLALLLGAFVLAIGPVEWVLLGRLGRRWLTWLTFPAICVLFTLVMIAVTDAFLGQSNRDESIVLIDVGADGRVLRRSELRMHFPTGERVDRHAVDGALVSIVDVGRYREHYYGSVSTPASARFEGRVGGRVTLEIRHRKWTPVVWRTLAFDAPESVPSFGDVWAAPQRADVDAIRAAEGVVDAFVVRRDYVEGEAGDERAFGREQIIALTGRRMAGYFRDVATISPSGGDALEDLAIHDKTDPRARVLVVVTGDDENRVVYRRAFRATED